MREELQKQNLTAGALAASKTTTSDHEDLQKVLRMSPETYASVCKYFDVLDSNQNGRLHEVEFERVDSRTDAKVAQRDIFTHFASAGEMTLPEFLRFFMLVLAKPSEFRWSSEDLKHLPTWEVWQDNDRLTLLKLFIVFDANTNGKITIVEFEQGWWGPLLWKLRSEEVLSSRFMSHTKEFEYAVRVFDKRSGSDLQMDLTEWVHFLWEARAKTVGGGQKAACVRMYHSGLISALVAVTHLSFA